jgi:hypothetical protein
MRRETIGVSGGLCCFIVAGLSVYEATILPSSSGVLANWLATVSAGLLFVGLGAFYFAFRTKIDEWVKPSLLRHVEVHDYGEGRDSVTVERRDSATVEGKAGVSVRATVKATQGRTVRMTRIIQIAVAGFVGGGVILYLGASLLHIASSGDYSAIPAIAVSFGGGAFLILFAIVQINSVRKA